MLHKVQQNRAFLAVTFIKKQNKITNPGAAELPQYNCDHPFAFFLINKIIWYHTYEKTLAYDVQRERKDSFPFELKSFDLNTKQYICDHGLVICMQSQWECFNPDVL